MRVTLKAIAAKANVSTMAVSAALNNTTGVRLSAEKREHIRKIAAEMGYRPNILAQKLSGGKSHLLGVIVDSCAPESIFQILRSVEAEAARNNYHVLAAEQHNSLKRITEICDIFDQYGVDGIVCLAHDYPSCREELQGVFRQIKNIVFWEQPYGIEAPYVSIDMTDALTQIAAGWKKTGRKHAAMLVNSTPNNFILSRINAFRNICREFALDFSVAEIPAVSGSTGALELIPAKIREEFIPGGVDAVLAESDLWALYLMRALSRQGLRVPDDIAVVGYDNTPECLVPQPELASISIRSDQLGQKLAETFFAVLQNGKVENSCVAAEFFPRGSCGWKDIE